MFRYMYKYREPFAVQVDVNSSPTIQVMCTCISKCFFLMSSAIIVIHRNGQGMKPSDVLSLVFSMVKGICQRHFTYVTFHCGPACPSNKCPGYQGDYISHPGVQQPSSRLHVFNVLPARQEDVYSSFYCVNQNFENDLKEWLL